VHGSVVRASRQALGVLTHHIAVEDCKKQAKEDACNLLKDKDIRRQRGGGHLPPQMHAED
jgi:hypothetical protein